MRDAQGTFRRGLQILSLRCVLFWDTAHCYAFRTHSNERLERDRESLCSEVFKPCIYTVSFCMVATGGSCLALTSKTLKASQVALLTKFVSVQFSCLHSVLAFHGGRQ